MRVPVWTLIALLISQLLIAVVLQIWFHNTVAAAVIVAACIIEVLMLKLRLDAGASTTPGVWAIDVSPFRIMCSAAIVVIGVIVIAALIWNA
ncbi:MAG: hypothetical protein ACRECP_12715 [Methylocella sp.]